MGKKQGDSYQELVGSVMRALYPGATVNVGVWVEGPDGRRDMDVEVRYFFEGEERLVLVECKDWKNKIGVEIIDALESKRRDLSAYEAVIFGNSFFTDGALRKAERVGIRVLSALKKDDEGVKIRLRRLQIFESVSVDKFALRFLFKEKVDVNEESFDIRDVFFEEIPMAHFFHKESQNILNDLSSSKKITVGYFFKEPIVFHINNEEIKPIGMACTYLCTKKYLGQEISEDVTLGCFDHLKKNVTIPDGQSYFLGTFNFNNLHEIADSEDVIKSYSKQLLSFKLFRPLFPELERKSLTIPDIESLLGKEKKFIYEDIL